MKRLIRVMTTVFMLCAFLLCFNCGFAYADEQNEADDVVPPSEETVPTDVAELTHGAATEGTEEGLETAEETVEEFADEDAIIDELENIEVLEESVIQEVADDVDEADESAYTVANTPLEQEMTLDSPTIEEQFINDSESVSVETELTVLPAQNAAATDSTSDLTTPESAPLMTGWDKANLSYYIDGVPQRGFVDIDDVTYYFDKAGILLKNSKEQLFKDSNGIYRYVNKDGIADATYTGLARSKTNYYYVENGVINKEHTGLVKSPTSRNRYYHVTDGKVNKKYTGLSKSVSNWYYVEDGLYDKLNATYNGPAQSYKSKAWYHVENSLMKKNQSGTSTTKYKKLTYTYQYTNGRLSNSVIVYTERIYFTDQAGRIKTKVGTVEAFDGSNYYVNPETSKVRKNEGFVEFEGNKYYVQYGGKLKKAVQFDVDGRHYGADKDCTVCEYTNSPLIDGSIITSQKSTRDGQKIKKITIHHMASVMSGEACARMFANKGRYASSNYTIGYAGDIWQSVDEWDRSWCSASYENDSQAITIEVSNSKRDGDWPVSDAVLEKVILLCVDVCKRNGIEKLIFTGDETGNLTMHNYFAATLCPGPYLGSKFPYIADTVNKRLEKERQAELKNQEGAENK